MTPTLEQTLDQRIHAVNSERGVVEAALAQQFPAFTPLTPRPASAAGHLGLHARPDAQAAQVTEALYGEALEVLEELEGGWAWVRTVHDGYLGYTRSEGLGEARPAPLKITALRAHLYAAPSIKAPLLSRLSSGAGLQVLGDQEQHGEYGWWRVAYRDREGFVRTSATDPQEPRSGEDFLRQYLGVPYVWGGRSAWGIDCSGLAQLMTRLPLPRDADQQRDFLPTTQTPRLGDLAFFPGHVGIMLDERRMIHANATHMAVSIETLGEGSYGRKLAQTLTGFGRVPDDLGATSTTQDAAE
ncbi:SH3 domain-containing protein [Deinococcus sp. KNUC1210]|uniref:C40 family peptidase n=1 Tax=Deinococcus sp. KNUC1210 TaxID=2917691 RepID=UPI001EF1475E|nr:SH3 domain-containing protein [Deinococcus sp. KNUC1210]ULH15827.1 SH3 domain-containing protein [Deinococcus sp. KNUC1210]